MIMGGKGTGDRVKFDPEACARDIDRKIQEKMYEQPPLKKWGIFYGDRDEQTAKTFKTTMDACLKQIGYEADAPALFPVKPGMKIDAWLQALKKNLNPSISAVVLILPG